MRIYSILARLLDYPDAELLRHLPRITEELERDQEVTAAEQEVLGDFIAWLRRHTLTELQSTYVQTFDMTPEHDLHLTHHLFGDDEGRGPALIALSEHFRAAGLEMTEGEIPDYLPLLLEFASLLEPLQARVFLGDAGKVLAVLADNLEEAGSPYSGLLRIVEGRGHLAKVA